MRVVERSRAFVTNARRQSIMHSAPSEVSSSVEASTNQLTAQYSKTTRSILIETSSILGG